MSDEQLLGMRFCDLKLSFERTPLARRVRRLYRELARRGIEFRPHVWLSEEWFSPDGVPGIAAPFYLAHPRLERLERRMMRHVEGGSAESGMRILVERADKRGLWLRGSRRLALRQSRRMLVHLMRLYAQGESPRLSL